MAKPLLPDELLAVPARLAAGRRLGAAAPRLARPARHGRPDRLEPREPGQRQRPGKKEGQAVGPNPTDRGKAGTKRHLVTDRAGGPRAALLTGANRHESVVCEALLDAVPPITRPAR